jgi:hypothetical protein
MNSGEAPNAIEVEAGSEEFERRHGCQIRHGESSSLRAHGTFPAFRLANSLHPSTLTLNHQLT